MSAKITAEHRAVLDSFLVDLYGQSWGPFTLSHQDLERIVMGIVRTRDREIARMARDSGINALIRFAEMLEADAPS